jgi:hypothetical protein
MSTLKLWPVEVNTTGLALVAAEIAIDVAGRFTLFPEA